MDCRNCGASMALDAGGRFLACAYCTSRYYPEPVDADGIQMLGVHADSPSCPLCETALASALIDTHAVHVCGTCRGILLPRRTFALVVDRRRAFAVGPASIPRPVDPSALTRKLSCPVCRATFQTYPHYGPGNVVIDNCTACDLLWLDFGEIRQIVAAPGKDRGRAS